VEYYPWLKAFHLIAAIAWMAGLLYLPRIYVYHCDAEPGSRQAATFKLMERRLLRAIMNPAMIATWVLGIWLAVAGNWWAAPWFHAKLLVVLGLAAMHGMLARWRREFERDANRHGAKFYRAVNEIPTVLMILIVVLAIVRPF